MVGSVRRGQSRRRCTRRPLRACKCSAATRREAPADRLGVWGVIFKEGLIRDAYAHRKLGAKQGSGLAKVSRKDRHIARMHHLRKTEGDCACLASFDARPASRC